MIGEKAQKKHTLIWHKILVLKWIISIQPLFLQKRFEKWRLHKKIPQYGGLYFLLQPAFWDTQFMIIGNI